ncbi:MAG: hypothetical protein ACODAQ_06450 [Phycisphaeraceae bacterium]
MATLELECPACGELLELDAAFAGSVCRCSHCGAMMSVPTDEQGSAEQVDRPDAPDGGELDEVAAALDEDDPSAPAANEPDDEAQTLTSTQPATATSATQTAPPKKKHRPLTRMLTMALLLLAVLALVGWTAGALIITFGIGQGDDATTPFGYDPDVNPYTMNELNVLALPLGGRSAVVVDASGAGRRWFALAQDAVRIGLTQPHGGGEIGLIYAAEPEPQALAETLTPAAQLTEERLQTFQGGIQPRGVAPLDAAVEAALAREPARIVLITGQRLDSAQVAPIEAALAQASHVMMDVVMIDAESDAAAALAEAHGGRYVRLSLAQLRRWYQDANVAEAE